MAKTLKEALQNSLQPTKGPAQLGSGQQILQGLAAQSGKAVQQAGPAASALGEQEAASQTALQAGQQQRQSQLAQESINLQGQGQEEAHKLQQQGLDEQRKNLVSQADRKAQELLTQFEQEGKTLDYAKDKARIDQAVTAARLSNDKYVTKLQQAGDKARLNDAAAFKDAVAKDVFGANRDLLAAKLDFTKMMSIDQNDFRKEMAKIDIQSAIQLLNQELKQASTTQMFQGAGGLVSGGAAAYSTYDANQNKKPGGTS